MSRFAIAGLQLYLPSREGNVELILSRIDLTMQLYPWIQMVLVSELAARGPLTRYAQPLPSADENAFRRAAEQHQIWLVPGSFFERKEDAIYNTAPVIAPDGTVIARYRKMFPFRPYEAGVDAGTEFVLFDVPEGGRFGLSICYDMWFPETSRTLAVQGAEVILHPSLTATIDRDVELAIARGTAATNQCFVFDINGCGVGGNGRSIVVGPDGDVLYQAGEIEQIIPLEIDLDRVRRSREFGLRGLGQTLKSFRERQVEFTIYWDRSQHPYLEQLGPLHKESRGGRAKARRPGPRSRTAAVVASRPAPDGEHPWVTSKPPGQAEVPAIPRDSEAPGREDRD